MTDRVGGWPARIVRVGPFSFLLRSPLRAAIDQIDTLYRDYPDMPADGIVDYAVAVVPDTLLRRWLRPKVRLVCDIEIPLMQPMPARHAALALEMGMNLQLAVGMQRYVLLHAAAVEREGDAMLLLGESGAGKSTMSAVLAYADWRLLGDEFALLDPVVGCLHPFPRPISLKNSAIDHMRARAPADRFGPVHEETIKGRIQHLLPPVSALAAMDVPARPRLIVMPQFVAGARPTARRMTPTETFVQLTRASPNYGSLGEPGFEALWRLLQQAPGYAIEYGSSEDALALVDRLWAEAPRG